MPRTPDEVGKPITLLVSCPGKDGEPECEGEFEIPAVLGYHPKGRLKYDVGDLSLFTCPSCGRTSGLAVRRRPEED